MIVVTSQIGAWNSTAAPNKRLVMNHSSLSNGGAAAGDGRGSLEYPLGKQVVRVVTMLVRHVATGSSCMHDLVIIVKNSPCSFGFLL